MTGALPHVEVVTEYVTGYEEGLRYAEQDLRDGNGTTNYWIGFFRDDIEQATTRGNRARAIGVLRGYRDAVRTQLGGRWGS